VGFIGSSVFCGGFSLANCCFVFRRLGLLFVGDVMQKIELATNLKALCQKCHLNHDAKLHAVNAANTRSKRKEGA
jgi:hypothetical protein